MRTDEAVNKYLDRPIPASMEDAQQFLKRLNDYIDNNESIAWVISLKDDPALLGSVCLWNISKETATGEIGFELHPRQQGKGIMTEAVSAALQYAFDVVQLRVVEGWVHLENLRSIKLMEKHHFKRDVHAESAHLGKDYFSNMAIYSLKNRNGEI